MTNNIITILLVGGIVWICYVKYQEYQYKTLQLLSKNHLLEIENQKMRAKIRYLQNYKTDVSKTFKILNNELSLIKENLPENTDHILTPQVFNSLTGSSPQTSHSESSSGTASDIFSTLFNRFLSQPVSVSIEAINEPEQPSSQPQTTTPNVPPPPQQPAQPPPQAPPQPPPPQLTTPTVSPQPQLTAPTVPPPPPPPMTPLPSIRLQLNETETDQTNLIERLQNEYSKYLM